LTSVLVHSGAAVPIFADDQHYAFRANAAFKSWAPLTDVPDCFIFFEPGRVPILLFNSPLDFWYKSADPPQGYWTRHFDIRAVAARSAARALLPADLSRTAFIGAADAEISSWGVGSVNPAKMVAYLDFARAVKSAYELACLRKANHLGARGHIAAARCVCRGRHGI
jgi:Xaa-Pro dipeptidase